jgi:hypothetical protein
VLKGECRVSARAVCLGSGFWVFSFWVEGLRLRFEPEKEDFKVPELALWKRRGGDMEAATGCVGAEGALRHEGSVHP